MTVAGPLSRRKSIPVLRLSKEYGHSSVNPGTRGTGFTMYRI